VSFGILLALYGGVAIRAIAVWAIRLLPRIGWWSFVSAINSFDNLHALDKFIPLPLDALGTLAVVAASVDCGHVCSSAYLWQYL
jgi:hypothetical protein